MRFPKGIELTDIQNCLCETEKYLRVIGGERKAEGPVHSGPELLVRSYKDTARALEIGGAGCYLGSRRSGNISHYTAGEAMVGCDLGVRTTAWAESLRWFPLVGRLAHAPADDRTPLRSDIVFDLLELGSDLFQLRHQAGQIVFVGSSAPLFEIPLLAD